jgi:putative PIN family toxin of toxin-antitoxin system
VPLVAVFDTNVLLSSVGWRGRPFQCVELARAGVIEGVICQELLDELVDKLQSKLCFDSEQVMEVVADLLGFLRIVPISGLLKVVAADPDDDKVVECAVVAMATHIVTGDRRHLIPLGNFQGIQIVSPAEFLVLAAAGPSTG